MELRPGHASRLRGVTASAHAPDAWRRFAALCGVLALAQAASMVLAARALAQTPACDQLKATLAARFEASGMRGFSLEAVPAATPVPAGAKAIGTCESGAYKVHYRRWAAARVPSAPASAALPATSAQAAATAEGPSRRAPSAKAERAAPPQAAPAPPAPVRAPEKPTAGDLAQAEAAAAADRAVAPPRPSSADATPASNSATAAPAAGLSADPWQWLGAVGLLAVLGGLWFWRARFGAYDKDGLPRGPRL